MRREVGIACQDTGHCEEDEASVCIRGFADVRRALGDGADECEGRDAPGAPARRFGRLDLDVDLQNVVDDLEAEDPQAEAIGGLGQGGSQMRLGILGDPARRPGLLQQALLRGRQAVGDE